MKTGNRAWGASCSPNAFAKEIEGKIEKRNNEEKI